jgi:hypothetical protein
MKVPSHYREPLVPPSEVEEFVQETVIPRWVKYGGVVAGAALVLARLGGVAYADDGNHGHAGDHDHDGVGPHHATHAGVSAHSGGDSSPAAAQATNPNGVRGEARGDAHGVKAGEAVNNDDHDRRGPTAKSAVSVKAAATAVASETAGTVQGDTAVRPAGTVAGATTTAATNASPAGVTAAANETAGTANAATPAGSETAGVVAGANITAAQTAGTVQGDTAQSALTRLSPRS